MGMAVSDGVNPSVIIDPEKPHISHEERGRQHFSQIQRIVDLQMQVDTRRERIEREAFQRKANPRITGIPCQYF
jgi:hypothetical protein